MARLIFKYTDNDYIESAREASEIEFVIPDELNIFEFKTICARLAAALGYHEESIKKAFGKLDETNNFTIKDLINEINKKGAEENDSPTDRTTYFKS
jgi:Holliday junction resolvasome RuvABC DNA-binding subunit